MDICLNASSRHFGFGAYYKEQEHLSCHPSRDEKSLTCKAYSKPSRDRCLVIVRSLSRDDLTRLCCANLGQPRDGKHTGTGVRPKKAEAYGDERRKARFSVSEGAPASLDVGYEPRRRQQHNHHDDREAIVSEPSAKFASPCWSNWKCHLWFFRNS